MKIISFIYVFILYILFVPGFLITKHRSCKLIYSLLFAIMLYATFDLINADIENMNGDITVQLSNMKSLVDSIQKNAELIDVNVDNKIFHDAPVDSSGIENLCKEKIKEIDSYKEKIKDLSSKLEGYGELENLISKLKETIQTL